MAIRILTLCFSVAALCLSVAALRNVANRCDCGDDCEDDGED